MRIIKLDAIDSTNHFLKALSAQENCENFTVVSTESQTEGKGQRGSGWVSESGKNLTFSVLYNQKVDGITSLFTLNIMVALSVVEALKLVSNLNFVIKWPNDILINNRKVSGLIAEVVGNGVVIGIGINVGMSEDQLPVETATSLLIEGGVDLTRDQILCEVLEEFEEHFVQWDQGSDEVHSLYNHLSATLGKEVRVEYPGGGTHLAVAESISDIGALILADGTHVQSADVIHLR